MMKAEDLFWLSVNAYHEARGEPFDGIVAVCHVVLNRQVAKHITVKAVVLAPMQFSWANGDARPAIKDYESFQMCMAAAMRAYEERFDGNTLLGADHYYADYIKMPRWAQNMKQVAKIGRHIFYRS